MDCIQNVPHRLMIWMLGPQPVALCGSCRIRGLAGRSISLGADLLRLCLPVSHVNRLCLMLLLPQLEHFEPPCFPTTTDWKLSEFMGQNKPSFLGGGWGRKKGEVDVLSHTQERWQVDPTKCSRLNDGHFGFLKDLFPMWPVHSL